MATYLTKANGDKYAVLEPNFLAARRTGQVRAQLPLDGTDFLTDPAQNGTLLKYDAVAGTVKKPGASSPEAVKGLMLHFSVEKEYDNIRPGLNNHAVWRQVANAFPGTPYPRLFQLHVGDTFTTDAVQTNAATRSAAQTITDYAALTLGHIYQVDANGFIDAATGNVGTTTGVRFKLIAKTTLPDGGYACKFEVTNVV
jgi:hypothetical protein